VAPVGKLAVAESRVTLGIDEPEMALVRLPKGKRRRTCVEEGSEAEESEAEVGEEVVEAGIIVAGSMPRQPRGMVGMAGLQLGRGGRDIRGA